MNDNSLKDSLRKHYFFLFIFTGYVVSFILFGNFTLFYIDKLDNEIVYNHILGSFYKGELNASEIFLNGETKIYWLRRLLQPYSLLYILDTEFAYWFFDIVTKILSYFSFYILAKQFTRNTIILSLSACFFASLNIYSIWGLLITFFPYFIYLVSFKKKLKPKHFFITIFVALNSEIVHSPYLIILSIFFMIAFSLNQKEKLKNLLIISSVFYFFVLLSNSNILYAFIFDGPFHREEMIQAKFIFNLKDIILNLFFLSNFIGEIKLDYGLVVDIPYIFFSIIFFPLIFFTKDKKLFYFIFFILLISALSLLSKNLDLFITKFWNPSYLSVYQIFIFSLIFLIINNKFKKIVPYSIFVIILFQTSSSFTPFAKKYIDPFKVNNFRNYYTFKGYYMKESYSEIKREVGKNKTLSIWPVDPMVAAMNGIFTIDGEHNLYPLSYKKKFYKIIKDELDLNPRFKDYYLNWGHRVYAFVSDPENILINFKEAKKIGASFVISKFLIENKNLELVKIVTGVENLFLYKIN